MTTKTPERRTWTVAEVAAMLGVGETTVREGVKAGIIPAVKLGSLIRIPKGAFERWLEQQQEAEG
jgi:excisionase family DNA binding protein